MDIAYPQNKKQKPMLLKLSKVDSQGIAASLKYKGQDIASILGEMYDDAKDAKATKVSQLFSNDIFIYLDNGEGMNDAGLIKLNTLYGHQDVREYGSTGKTGIGLKISISCLCHQHKRDEPLVEDQYTHLILSKKQTGSIRQTWGLYTKIACKDTDPQNAEDEQKEFFKTIRELFGFTSSQGTIIIISRQPDYFLSPRTCYAQVLEFARNKAYDRSALTPASLLTYYFRTMHNNIYVSVNDTNLVESDNFDLKKLGFYNVFNDATRSITFQCHVVGTRLLFKKIDGTTVENSKIPNQWFYFLNNTKEERISLSDYDPTDNSADFKFMWTLVTPRRELTGKNSLKYFGRRYFVRCGVGIYQDKSPQGHPNLQRVSEMFSWDEDNDDFVAIQELKSANVVLTQRAHLPANLRKIKTWMCKYEWKIIDDDNKINKPKTSLEQYFGPINNDSDDDDDDELDDDDEEEENIEEETKECVVDGNKVEHEECVVVINEQSEQDEHNNEQKTEEEEVNSENDAKKNKSKLPRNYFTDKQKNMQYIRQNYTDPLTTLPLHLNATDCDHDDGDRSNNETGNGVLLSTHMHAIKTRNPGLYATYKNEAINSFKNGNYGDGNTFSISAFAESFRNHINSRAFQLLCLKESRDGPETEIPVMFKNQMLIWDALFPKSLNLERPEWKLKRFPKKKRKSRAKNAK